MPGTSTRHRHGPLAPLSPPPSPPAPAPVARALLRAHATARGSAGAGRRLRADRPARARARAGHHRRRPRRAPRLPGPVRPGRRLRGPAVRRRGVRPRLLLERDRARPARRAGWRSRAEIRRVGTGLVRADPRLVVPARAPRAAARSPTGCRCGCAVPTGASAPRASGRRSRCCGGSRSRRCSGRRWRARRPAREELGLRSDAFGLR